MQAVFFLQQQQQQQHRIIAVPDQTASSFNFRLQASTDAFKSTGTRGRPTFGL